MQPIIKEADMRFAVIIEEDELDGGYIARVPAIKGCLTQADTLDELKHRIREVIEVSLDETTPSRTHLLEIVEMEVSCATTADH